MLEEAVEDVKTDSVKARNNKKRSLPEGITGFDVKNEMPNSLLEVSATLEPQFDRSLETGVETTDDPEQVSLVQEKKIKWRNRSCGKHMPEDGDSVDHEYEEGGMNGSNQMTAMSTSRQSGARNCEGKETLLDTNQTKSTAFPIDGKVNSLVSLDADETKHVTQPISDKENHLSQTLRSSTIRRPVGPLKKKLLILDINGLLADIVFHPPKDYEPDTVLAGRAVFKRPFCSDFLKFCFDRFEVGVWSSRTKRNVDRLVDYLLGDMKPKLLFCWDQSQCTVTEFRTLGNNHKSLVFKELRKIWEKQEPNLIWGNGYYNESNTLLLDDTPYKALLNPPFTAVFPYSYTFQDRNDNSLGDGGDLRLYLEGLSMAEDVQKYVEQHPIGQSSITEQSESWPYYHQVISSFSTMDSSARIQT